MALLKRREFSILPSALLSDVNEIKFFSFSVPYWARRGWCQNVSSNTTLHLSVTVRKWENKTELKVTGWTLLSPCKEVALVLASYLNTFGEFSSILTVIYDRTPLALVSCHYFIWHFLGWLLARLYWNEPSFTQDHSVMCLFYCVLKNWSCQEELCVAVIPNIVSDSFSTFNHFTLFLVKSFKRAVRCLLPTCLD